MDAAALVGGRNFFLPTRDDDIRRFFEANFPLGYLNSTVSGPVITANQEEETVYVTASAAVDTSFMRIFGFDTLNVSAEAEVTRSLQALDIVLAMDMSGSMTASATGGGTRIEAARAAATELVNVLFGPDETKELLNIGLVPWNGKVNVTLNGSVFDQALTVTQPVAAFTNPETGLPQSEIYFANNSPVELLAPPPATWQGCVFSRYSFDADDTNDADTLLPPVTVGGADWVAWQPIGPEGKPVSGGTCTLAVGGSECRPCLNAAITPLQNTKSTIQNAIDTLLNPLGTTNITQGLGWAWRVLKPTAPFTEANSGDGYKTVFGTGTPAGPAGMDARLLELAGNLKGDGVILYAIQFANGGTALQTLLQQVASGPGSPYYHYAPDVTTLQQVFVEVANHLSELRLSK